MIFDTLYFIVVKNTNIKVKSKKMNGLLKSIAENKAKLSKLLKNKDNRDVLYNWLKTELAYTSNAIEGNTLTRRETTLAIEENVTSGSKPISHYVEAVNHAKAFELVKELAKKKLPVDNNVILQIHKCILSGIDDANAGCYRRVPVRISGSRTVLPNPMKVPDLMEQFNHWLTTTDEDIVYKAINAHYRLVTIHPFKDGNGRTARLLMNLILMQAGFTPTIIRKIDRKRYLDALEKYQTTGNEDTYHNFMLAALNRSLKTAIDMLDTNAPDISDTKLVTIAKYAKLKGVPTSTIRYWVQIGKIKPTAYTDAGYMMFDPNK